MLPTSPFLLTPDIVCFLLHISCFKNVITVQFHLQISLLCPIVMYFVSTYIINSNLEFSIFALNSQGVFYVNYVKNENMGFYICLLAMLFFYCLFLTVHSNFISCHFLLAFFFSISYSSELLVTDSHSFILIENVCFTHFLSTLWRCGFLQSSGLHCFWWEIRYYCLCFPWAAFKIFLLDS